MIPRSRLIKTLAILVVSLTVCTLLLAQLEPALNSSTAPPAALSAQAGRAADAADLSRWRYIVLHHSATSGGNADRFAADHRQRFGAQSVGYHFVIGCGDGSEDGSIEICPRWKNQQAGAHADVDGRPEYNQQGIGICLVGNLEQTPPTKRQIQSLGLLVDRLQELCGIPEQNVVFHGDLEASACPGRYLREAWRQVRHGRR